MPGTLSSTREPSALPGGNVTTNQSDRAVIWYRYDPAEDQLSEFRLGSGLAERCLHHEGRNLCVLRGSLPSDPTLLQRLFACTADEFASGWTERVAAEFPPDPANPGRLINQWACSKIAEVVEYRARQAAKSRAGAAGSGSCRATGKRAPSDRYTSGRATGKRAPSLTSS